MVLDCEVSGIEAVHFGFRKILQKRFTTGGRKKDIRLSPEDDRFWLIVAKKLLPNGVQLNILPVIVEKVQIYANCVGPFHKSKI